MYDFDAEWLAKLDALRDQGVNPYPNGLAVTHTSTQLHAAYADVEDPSADPAGKGVTVGGRLMFRNRMGRSMFLRLQDRGEPTVPDPRDESDEPQRLGGLIQAYARREEVADEVFEQMKKLDIGDFVWVRGDVMRTRTGELTVKVSEFCLASKILVPFPDRFHSVTDVETRARQRYVDLFMNEGTRAAFRLRSRVLSFVRRFFEARDYLEVETPMMQVIPGGAAAKPFITHHNTLGMDLYLRIAPELYLKRLVVGGLERVFELNRNFRNEGISVKHNPEFTMLEFYAAWATYEDHMALSEELITSLIREVCDGQLVRSYGGRTIDFSPPWRRATYAELITEATGLEADQLADPAAMEAWWKANHPADEGPLPATRGKWWEWIFEEHVEHTLVDPTFVTAFPAEISPLARRNDDDPSLVDRFELIVNGWELANAFSELNDPVDQAARFEAQAKARAEGDEESMYFDADYVRALTYAMPPAAGEGIGIDRLVMLLTGRTSIREVILFPTLRPEQPTDG